MKDKLHFIDTNIFIYIFDDQSNAKKAKAVSLIKKALETGNGVISTQVIQEFSNVATSKFSVPIKTLDLIDWVENYMQPMCSVVITPDLIIQAIILKEKYKLGFYDSIIVASAISASCEVLFSEDLQNGQVIEGLEIINPFA